VRFVKSCGPGQLKSCRLKSWTTAGLAALCVAAPALTAVAQTAPAQPTPAQTAPTQTAPTQTAPTQTAPTQAAAPPAAAVDPKVAGILRAACDTLSHAKAMSFTAVDTYEHAALNGQPLYYTVKSLVTLQRPDKLKVVKLGDGVPDEFYYDGKTMAAYIPSANLVAVADAPPTIDAMLDAAWNLAAVYFPFSDVLVAHPCEVFQGRMGSAFYVGQSHVVGNTTTDMVAVAGNDVQAELWIGAKDHLPRMVRVVYPDEPAHARYSTEYSDWKITDSVPAETFHSAKAMAAPRMPFQPPGTGAIPKPPGSPVGNSTPKQPG
jgi:hypothetical protein